MYIGIKRDIIMPILTKAIEQQLLEQHVYGLNIKVHEIALTDLGNCVIKCDYEAEDIKE